MSETQFEIKVEMEDILKFNITLYLLFSLVKLNEDGYIAAHIQVKRLH